MGALFTAGVLVAWTEDDAVDRIIRQKYETYDKAMSSRDPKPILKMMDTKFYSIAEDGEVSPYKKNVTELKRQLTKATWVYSKSRIKNIWNDGRTAKVTVEQVLSMIAVIGASKKPQKIVVRTNSLDTWDKLRGKWVITRVNIAKQRTKILPVTTAKG